LACVPCNSAKSDRLPERKFMDKLTSVNAARTLPPAVSALIIPAPDVYRLYDAAISVEWPGTWAPRPWST
jgi:hypothetical protein